MFMGAERWQWTRPVGTMGPSTHAYGGTRMGEIGDNVVDPGVFQSAEPRRAGCS